MGALPLHLSIHHPDLPVKLESLDMMGNKAHKARKETVVLRGRKAIRGLQDSQEGMATMVLVSLAGAHLHHPS
jgi:hypothetical protein